MQKRQSVFAPCKKQIALMGEMTEWSVPLLTGVYQFCGGSNLSRKGCLPRVAIVFFTCRNCRWTLFREAVFCTIGIEKSQLVGTFREYCAKLLAKMSTRHGNTTFPTAD